MFDLRTESHPGFNPLGLYAGYEGGKHQGGWGTENVIIPLGQGYLEIAAVFDPVAAQTCDWGKCVCRSMEAPLLPPDWIYCARMQICRVMFTAPACSMLGH